VKRRGAAAEQGSDEWEESWTFIGDENDPELTQRIIDWDPHVTKKHSVADT
jgi:sterol 3beta-glucosyltransferase